MKDERLMRDLAEAVRRRAEGRPAWLDDRWERLAAGTLPPEERARLMELAERSEEARRLWELCQPLDPEVRGRIVERIVEPAAKKAPAPVVRNAERRLHGGAWWWAPASVVAASVAAVVMLWPGRAAAPLPGYSALLAGGVQVQRSPDSPPAVPTFQPGTRFELILRPETRVEGPIQVRGFLARGDALEPWEAPAEIDPGGAVRIAGLVGEEIHLPPGEGTLWLVVGRPGEMPRAEDLRAHLDGRAPPQRSWIALPVPLRVRAP